MYDMCFVCLSTKTLQFFFFVICVVAGAVVSSLPFAIYFQTAIRQHEESSLQLLLVIFVTDFFPLDFFWYSQPKQRYWLISVWDIFTSCQTHKRVRPLSFHSFFDHFVLFLFFLLLLFILIHCILLFRILSNLIFFSPSVLIQYQTVTYTDWSICSSSYFRREPSLLILFLIVTMCQLSPFSRWQFGRHTTKFVGKTKLQ